MPDLSGYALKQRVHLQYGLCFEINLFYIYNDVAIVESDGETLEDSDWEFLRILICRIVMRSIQAPDRMKAVAK